MPVIGVTSALLNTDTTGAWQHIATHLAYLNTGAALLFGVLTLSLVIKLRLAHGCLSLSWRLAVALVLGTTARFSTYVLAYAWTDLLVLAALFKAGYDRTNIILVNFSRITSSDGDCCALWGFSYIYLTVWPLFRQHSRRQIESAQSLGSSAWSTWWRIVLPSVRPVLAARRRWSG